MKDGLHLSNVSEIRRACHLHSPSGLCSYPFFRKTVFLLSQNYLFQIGVIDTGLESVFTIGCATAACEKGTVTEDGLSVIGCCTGDRCLPQALISGATQLKIARILCVLFAVIGLSRV